LKYKKIIIPPNIDINDWIDENRSVIMDTLYNNIFDFIESVEDKRIVLEVVFKKKLKMNYSDFDGISMDFLITKKDISETVDRLLYYYEDLEEYEKCANLIKLK